MGGYRVDLRYRYSKLSGKVVVMTMHPIEGFFFDNGCYEAGKAGKKRESWAGTITSTEGNEKKKS